MIHMLSSRSIFNSEWAKPYVLDYIKPGMKAVIIGFSFFGLYDEKKYRSEYAKGAPYDEKMRMMFEDLGVSYTWIYYREDSIESAKKKLKEADIIYFPGGAPDLMMMRIYEYDLVNEIRVHQGIFMGSSAGAMIQKDVFHISPDSDYKHFMLCEGLGLIDQFHFEVHYRRRKKQKKAIRKMHQMLPLPVFTIGEEGLLIVDNDHVTLVGDARWMYDNKGVVHI